MQVSFDVRNTAKGVIEGQRRSTPRYQVSFQVSFHVCRSFSIYVGLGFWFFLKVSFPVDRSLLGLFSWTFLFMGVGVF